jgi:hypothetical protein
MANSILSVVAGLVSWVVITTVAGLIMRGAWPEYAAVADAMTFTLPMMWARLSIGYLATVIAGCAAAIVARRPTAAAVATGVILLALFVPQHILIWARFPVWYHLAFLLSLVPLAYLGGIAARWRQVAISGERVSLPRST